MSTPIFPADISAMSQETTRAFQQHILAICEGETIEPQKLFIQVNMIGAVLYTAVRHQKMLYSFEDASDLETLANRLIDTAHLMCHCLNEAARSDTE